MTQNPAAETKSSCETRRLATKTSAPGGTSPSGHRGDAGQGVLLRRAGNRPGRRLASRTAAGSHPPLLSAAKERRLAKRIKAGDQRAQQELVLAHRKLVFRIARAYKPSGISPEDLVQEGCVGLIRAAQNFNPATHAIRFSSYATFWIRAYIQRAVSNNSSLVRLPEHTRLKRERYLRAIRELENQNHEETEALGPEPAIRAEIARCLGISVRQIERGWPVLAERAFGELPDESPTDSQTAENELLEREEHAVVHGALRRLSPFEAWVIRERFGLGEWSSHPIDARHLSRKAAARDTTDQPRDGRHSRSANEARPSVSYYGRSYDQLSGDCGLSVHRIRVIERAALDKLRWILGPAVEFGL